MLFIYIINNPDWYLEKKYKYGFTKDIINRLKNSHEQHSYLSELKSLYKIEITDKYKLKYNEYDQIISILSRNERKLNKLKSLYNYHFQNLYNINKYLVNNNGGIEFIYENGLELFENILFNDYKKLGLIITKINKEDIENINKEIKKYININDDSFDLRDYQKKIIEYSVKQLIETNKIYIELATGGGKSVITYNIFNEINPEIIIIFTPRKIINEQNIKLDYLLILDDDYEIIYDIIKPITNKTIISVCIQSSSKIIEKIKEFNIRNIFIWFDEAHWGVEGKSEELSNFLLKDNEYIKYRCFTSASPNKKIIKEHKDIFGDLYKPIKVKELIKQKWLCNIKPHIFSEKKDLPNIINIILDSFINNNRIYGFSFHNDCINACNLFKKHYELFINKETDIKPFILVSNYYDLNDINLDYNYKDIKTFEKTKKSIGYVVQMYNMGYDFNLLDFISITDPKLSSEDIIQTIGRGMRPDKLGENGTNLNKELYLLIPDHINNDNINNKYENIIKVLKYLLYNLELSYNDIQFLYNENDKIENTKNEKEDKYIGEEYVNTILYKLLKDENEFKWKDYHKITKHLKKKNIHNQKEYNEYIKNNDILNLPENLSITYKEFKWIDTYKENECPYYNKKDCILNIKKYYKELNKISKDSNKIEYLNNIDNKIPNECLWRFYGGLRREYFID